MIRYFLFIAQPLSARRTPSTARRPFASMLTTWISTFSAEEANRLEERKTEKRQAAAAKRKAKAFSAWFKAPAKPSE